MNIDKYTQFISARRRIVLVATGIIMATALAGIFRLRINTDFGVFMPPDSPQLESLRQMDDSFGDSSQLLVLAEIGSDIELEPESEGDVLDRLRPIASELNEVEGVQSAQTPIPDRIANLPPRERQIALEQLKALSGDSALIEYEGIYHALFRLLLAADAHPASIIDEVEAVFGTAGFPILISGEPFLEAKIFDYILRVIVTIPPAAILLMLVVFRLRIGSVRATILSMIPAIVGAAITLGLLGWITGGISIVTAIVPIFIIVLGSADGLHVTSHVTDSIGSGSDNLGAVTITLRAVGSPIIMTTVTTMAGFLSLLVINSQAVDLKRI